MREVKYRIYSKSRKEMFPDGFGESVCSGMIKMALAYNEQSIKLGKGPVFSKDSLPKTGIYLPTDDKDLIFMDYTGLIDKTSNRIFNGDILKDDEKFLWKVHFKQGAYYAECNDLMADQLLSSVNLYCKVVGNVYDNADLLRV
ncbi:hypothetical protein FLK61_26090 [Paenalkalicoccus suaedae]|uniref:YopX protein domain-containing protein n=1 Tax=Paenalkalicoccus suaedae TaxID=2592382 RepID=A0A859FCE5_9BACI|nr:YopX family protein [Paenalkalicoccus suaedae]QKS70234.1 hypothetical protein FLK61_26090 [Paenalkalicoccus suaedae]